MQLVVKSETQPSRGQSRWCNLRAEGGVSARIMTCCVKSQRARWVVVVSRVARNVYKIRTSAVPLLTVRSFTSSAPFSHSYSTVFQSSATPFLFLFSNQDAIETSHRRCGARWYLCRSASCQHLHLRLLHHRTPKEQHTCEPVHFTHTCGEHRCHWVRELHFPE